MREIQPEGEGPVVGDLVLRQHLKKRFQGAPFFKCLGRQIHKNLDFMTLDGEFGSVAGPFFWTLQSLSSHVDAGFWLTLH